MCRRRGGRRLQPGLQQGPLSCLPAGALAALLPQQPVAVKRSAITSTLRQMSFPCPCQSGDNSLQDRLVSASGIADYPLCSNTKSHLVCHSLPLLCLQSTQPVQRYKIGLGCVLCPCLYSSTSSGQQAQCKCSTQLVALTHSSLVPLWHLLCFALNGN